MDRRSPSEDYEKVGRELIEREERLGYIKRSGARIAFLASEAEKKSKRRVVHAECEKVPDKYKWAVPYDFTVTVFTANCERFTGKQMRILLLHELMRVGIELDGNEERYYVVPHDVEDFRAIINQYGLDWSA